MHTSLTFKTLCCSFLAIATWLQVGPASACSIPSDGIDSRRTYPASGATAVPTNARIVVIYTWITNRTNPPREPGLGLAVRKAGGAPLAASVTAIGTPGDWRDAKQLVIQPQAALEANTTYEVVDQHPVVPCYGGSPKPCEDGQTTAFATFTTGAGADTTPPRFEGLGVVMPQERLTVCAHSCCNFDTTTKSISLKWDVGSDDGAGSALAYNIYRDGQLFMPLVSALSLEGVQICSGGGMVGTVLPPGAYTVRAVDWAGNEDANSRLQSLANVCATIVAPDTDAGIDAGTDGGTDASTGSPDAAVRTDGSIPPTDASAIDAASADAGGGVKPQDDGCGCRVGGNTSSGGGFALAFMASLVFWWRRRARGSL